MTLFNRMGRLARRRNPKRSIIVDFEQCEQRFLLATVTTTADSGATSLRQVIMAGNSHPGMPFTIDFNIPTTDKGWNPLNSTFTFDLTGKALPAITAPVTIDGMSESMKLNQTAYLAINGKGISVSPNGLDLAAAGAVGSNISGLEILNWIGAGILIQSANNVIGGTTAPTAKVIGSANIIGSNGTAGIQITGANATGNTVLGNFIGTDPSNDNLGNAAAVQVFNASGNIIGGIVSGAGNTVGFNTNSGIGILSGNANLVRENTFIGTNGTLTQPTVAANDIGLGPGANNNQPAPILISASHSGKQLSVLLTDSVPNGIPVIVDLYLLDPKPVERMFLGTDMVTSAAPFSASIQLPSGVVVNDKDKIIATATTANGTSIFSTFVSVANPFTVTNTYNSGPGTLSAAITNADMTPNSTISFNIPLSDPGYSSGTWTITLSTALPFITAPTTINGTTNNVPAIAINGSKISTPADGLVLTSISGSTSDGSKILGLDIYGFASGAGIHIQSNHDLIASDYLGTNVSGTAAGPGNREGVLIDGTAGSNTIGGTTAAAANVIGSNTAAGVSIGGTPTSGNLVAGNFIGTNSSGANLGDVVGVAVASSGNTIGGTASGFGNIIGFNTATGGAGAGVSISGVTSTGDLIAGNYIGTNATGNHMANDAGVVINGSSSNTVGGNVSAAGNTIAFNDGDGVNVITGTENPILRNLIYTNGEGIVLTSGGNNGQTLPKITGVTSVATGVNTTNTTITVDLTAKTFSSTSTYSLDFFASAPGDPVTGVQAHIYLGTHKFMGGTTGSVTFMSLTTPLSTSQTVTATATLLAVSNFTFTDTSTFAAPVSVPVPFLVTTTGATGPGSLQQAILDADADKTNPNPDLIKFAIATGSAPYMIQLPPKGLQPITRPVILDATSQTGYSGAPIIVLDGTGLTSGSGLVLGPGSDGSTIEGFDIVNFKTAGFDGIDVESGNNVLQANYVGVETDRVTPGANAQGVLINGSNNTIGGTAAGAANVIALNTGDNVNVKSGNGNAIRENSIYLSGGTPPLPPLPPSFSGEGIVLGSNNDGQAAPTNLSVSSVPTLTIIQGTITGKVAGSYTVDFFASNPSDTFGPAYQFLGSTIVALTGPGTKSFTGSLNIPILTPGQSVTATVTSPAAATSPHANNTSPFAASVVFVATSNFMVTNTDDSGNGSLRQAIMNADSSPGQQTIQFAIPSTDPNYDSATQTWTIRLSAFNPTNGTGGPLPTITNEVFLLDGQLQESQIPPTTPPTPPPDHPLIRIDGGNLTSPGSGLVLGTGSDGSIIQNLDIRDFADEGIDIQSSFNSITEDVIGSNTLAGVSISGASITGNALSGNFIGTDAAGHPLANAVGVVINNGASNNAIGGVGAANTIAFNSVGVQVDGAVSPPSTGNVISQNLIFSNVANYSPSAIVLSNGGNKGQTAPDGLAFTSVQDLTTIDGQIVNPMVGGSYTVEFFASSSADNPASQYLGSLVVVIPSQAPTGGTLGGFTASFSNIDFNNLAGQSVTATVTGPGGNTSPFATPVPQSPQFDVTNTTDNVPGKEVGSLRIAILNADFADLSSNTIGFQIPGGGSFVIAPTTPLPAIIVPALTLDGTQQSGYASVPLVEISGASISGSADGLTLGALSIGSKIEGLDIANFTGGAGIHIESNNDLITGNFLGTDLTGKAAGPGNQVGVLIDDSSGNTIGGTVSGAGNTIGFSSIAGIEMINSGATGNVVEGNFIGTDSAGDILPNTVGVLDNTTGNAIGALNVLNKDGSIQVLNGNLIGFNTTAGIQITGTGTAGDVVTGNLIGTDSAGDPRANGVGVIVGTGNNVIGGIVSGSANVIDFNSSAGIQITGPSDANGTGNVVEGNFIGTNPSKPKLNQGNGVGVQIASAFNNTIGGTTAVAANLIGFNSAEGIQITGTGALDNLVEGNFIGTDTTGTVNQANGVGVQIVNASDNAIGGTGQGQGNTIGFNTQNGVLVRSGIENSIRENEYVGNTTNEPSATSDIFLGPKANNDQAAPDVISASLSGTQLSIFFTDGVPSGTSVFLDIYRVVPPSGTVAGAREFLGTTPSAVIVEDGGSNASITLTQVPSGFTGNGSQDIVATATVAVNGTSVFSGPDAVWNPLTVTNTFDQIIDPMPPHLRDVTAVGSLREAITFADAAPTANTISFQISGANGFVITPNSGLPPISAPVTVDGESESGYNGVPLVEISGGGQAFDGLVLETGSAGSTIEGLSIYGFGNKTNSTTFAGVHVFTNGNTITADWIGSSPSIKGVSSNAIGVLIDNSTGNTIGRTATGAGNIIDSNTSAGVSISGTSATDNVVEGNFIGTDPSGDTGLGNLVGVFGGGGNNTVGGTTAGAANIIGANNSVGVELDGTSGDRVEGNYIGTDSAGDKLDNHVGVSVDSGSNTIGGSTSSGANTIGFNTLAGVSILGSGNIVAGNFIGTDSLGSSGSGGTNLGNGLGVFVGGANNTIGALNAVNADGTINISNGLNGNLIAFNTNAGVSISGTSATGNVVEGNLIGTDTFLNLLGNQVGVVISNGASANTIGGTPNKSPITIKETISSLGTNANYIVGNTTAGVSIGGATSSPNNTVEGNLISRNALNGIDLEGDLTGTTGLAQIEYNFIGTNQFGTGTYDSNNHPLGNGLSGILLEETSASALPGTSEAVTVVGNVISGNGLSGITVKSMNGPLAMVEISSNIIGLDATGSHAVDSGSLPLGNVLDGILINNVVDVTVGDPSAGMVPTTPSNVISGNLGRGIEVRGQSLSPVPNGTNTIEGNYIGTDATGRRAVSSSANINYSLGNLADGIFLFVPPNTQVENNLVSNNRSAGIHAATQSSGGSVAPSGTITIQSNLIGTDVTGEQDTDLTNQTVSLGNGSDGVFLDSITSGASIQGNVISGNRANGINLLDSSNVVILKNEIGTDMSGSSANLGNDSNGIFINGSSDVTVGGTDSATDQNIISGNLATGILISGASFTEFPAPTLKSSPLGITLGPDGNFWFTESAADQIGMINPTTGTITEFPIPTASSDPSGITSGSDGNLWFTETKADKIGEINPTTHKITEFPIPTADSGPTGITSGPSGGTAGNVIPGNLWFTETNANQIGEINPTTHQISEFPIPTANSGPTGITAGPDGNLWFTETNTSKIGMLVYSPTTNTAAITDFATKTPNSGPTGITAGPNGNLWFTETSANQIGEVTTTGAIVTEVPIPTANSGPTGITLGSDGSLWFTETNASQIAGINPTTGAFKEFAIPTMNSGPSGIVSSPTGSLWFTEASGNRIGRFANTFPTSHNVIQGNDIGLNALETVAIPNHDSGVVISQGDNNMIGGAATGAGNLISGNLLYGVLISGGGSNNAIEGNDIGTGASGFGASGLGNTADGVFLLGGNPMDQNETVTQNTVSQNVISGNASNGIQVFGQGSTENTVSNNLIGIDVDGKPVPNLGNGVFLNDAGPNNVIGTGNVIAGNDQSGVMIVSDNLNFGNDSYVAGNYIGTDANGTRNIGNGADGIFIYGSSGNTIGGTGAGNVISGNDQSGVVILTPAFSALADNNQVIGNQIGTNSGGTAPLPNQSDGVEIIDSVANTIGPNNVVSGNLGNGVLIESLSNGGGGSPMASKNLVFGNQIGSYGTAANLLFNGQNGVLVSNSSSNTIGGVSSNTVFAANVPIAPSNVISGNVVAGIQFFGTSQDNLVLGNYIGVDADGSTVPGTAQSQAYGVYINDPGGSTGQESIGGTGAGQGNLISGNGTGIQITGPQNSAGGLNSIQGNVIGLDKLDDTRAGNSIGVYILNSASNTIGGTSTNVFPGTTVPVTPNNVISGNAQEGILITGSVSTNNLVAGNDIGTNLDGTGFPSGSTESAPGQFSGVLINNAASNNIIGGAAAGNVISGNDIGVQVVGLKTANGNIVGGQELIMDNLIGTDATGTRAVSNIEFGILINNSASNTIGPGNLLSANGVGGVELLNAGSVRNRVIGNRIGTDINSKLAFQSTSFGTATTSDGITVYRNAQLNGVVVLGASSNTIGATTSTPGQGNYIAGNIQVGAYITSRDFHNQVYPQPVGNWISGNTFNHNPIYGILFYDATNNLAPRFVGRGGGLINNSFIKTRTPFRNYVNSFDIKTKLVPSQAKRSHHSAHKTKRHPTKASALVETQVRPRVPALFEAGSRHVVVHVNKAKARKHGG